MASKSKSTRIIALVVGVFLLIGGIAGLVAQDALAASKVGAAIAVLAGLVFLRISAKANA
ncbi:hypothetical protein [Actinokineospora bangkokensis]|uniref:Uncharacterized protein n=1 Tax=Actinokineospora bangkokensis TaxID=1193682 RepID=A0A1Q9LP03_9PSEU|nr:hypothetical protein [Actinokineospora bangkokensis]OLR93787.1 hypothetical protein BJP25_16225 [Actinokineospora bangkokensis]